MSKVDAFKCHSDKQEQLIFSENQTTVGITGIQWAKTTSGAWWMKRQMFEYQNVDDAFIICAPTYKIMQQSTLPAFLNIMEPWGIYKYADAVFQMYGGGICYLRTGTDPNSIVGITNVRAIWGDEAGLYTLYFWENIQARAAFKKAKVLLTTSPYTLNWMYRDIFKPYKQGKRPDINLIQARSTENPFFPLEEYQRQEKIMDPRRFNALYNGEFEKMQGLVFDCFDDELNYCEPFTLPIGSKFYAGVDWGTTHPFVIVVRGITPNDEHYQVSEFYKTGFTITDMIQIAKSLKQVWGIQAFWCDPSEPGYIQEFNRNGLSAFPADNDIRRGLDLHYALIKTRRYKIFRNTSTYTQDELDTYHYPEPKDLRPDQADIEQVPVDQNNHCIDANRYVTIMTNGIIKKKQPFVPGLVKTKETNMQRIKRLKILPNKERVEDWS